VKRIILPALTLLLSTTGVNVVGIGSATAAPSGTATGQSSVAAQPTAPTQPTTQPTAPAQQPASSTGSIAKPASAATDTTPPDPVTSLAMTGNTVSSVTLGWTNPTDADLAHVIIRRAVGGTAPAAGQGTLVATLGTKTTSYTDKSLTNATAYSYALFAQDKTGNLSAAATVTAYTAATDGHTGIQGKLTDSAGHGIGNLLVHVQLGGSDAGDAVTSSTGAYSVTNLLPGSYTVCYEPKTNVGGNSVSGYLAGCYHQQPNPGGTPVTVTAGSITANVNDTLAPAGALSGRITGPDGSPIAGVAVTTTSYGISYQYMSAITSSDGVYLVKNLPPNRYFSICFDPSKAVGSSPDGYLGDCPYNYPPPVAGKITTFNMTLNVGGIITGVVRDHNGNPVVGAKVYDTNYGVPPIVTDAQGRYRFANLPAGGHTLCADGSAAPASATAPYGYINGCYDIYVVTVTVQLNQNVTQDLALGQNGAMGGTLRRSDGAPAANTQIQLFTSDGYSTGSLQTDANGNWQVDEQPGQYYACYVANDPIDLNTCHTAARFNDYYPYYPAGDLITVAEGVRTPVNDTLLAGGVVSGTVTGPDGAPLANATVQINDSEYLQDRQVVTDSAGHYSVAGLTDGQYRVCVTVSQDHQPGSPGLTDHCYGRTAADEYPYALSVNPGQRLTIDLQVELATEIEGRITDSAGDPVSNVSVYITNQAGTNDGQVWTDSNGDFDLYQLTPGDYTLCYSGAYAAPQPVTGYLDGCWQNKPVDGTGDPVHGVAGQVSTVNPVLMDAGGIAGTVTDSSGSAASYIYVTAVGSDGSILASTYADYQGNYQLTGLPIAPVAVCTAGWGYQQVCYADAPDYQSATLVTPTAGTMVTGVDFQVTAGTSPQVGVNRPGPAQRASRTA